MDDHDEGSPFPFGGSDGSSAPTAADGWEAVAQCSSEEHGKGWELVVGAAKGPSAHDDCSIFPPSLHEGLHLRPDPFPTLTPTPTPPLSPQEQVRVVEERPSSSPMWHDEAGDMHPASWGPISDSARRLLGSGLEMIHEKFSICRGEGGRGGLACLAGCGVWSIAAVAGFVGALMYMRRRHRREKELLLLLVQEKDQRIGELLNQIALLNHIIAVPHRASVLRRA